MTSIASLLDPRIDPLFWDSLRPTTTSAWHGHVPFAHWVVAAARPRVLVELGTHAGVSYAAFCHAVQRSGLQTQCTAVDTWQGDEHAGTYSDDVFTEWAAFHDTHFAGFSRLLRKTFDAALDDVADGSVDLLHIDGFHTYEAVSHDFHSWRPKLSDRAVVLFHDTHVRERGFGVWRFWDEVRDTGHGSLDFAHAHGLGVLLVGANAPAALREICAAPIDAVRARFEALGARMVREADSGRVPPVVEPLGSPAFDANADPGPIFIAERFEGPSDLHALRLPRDAVTRGEGGCTVWITSPRGHEWRQGRIMPEGDGDAVTLAFAPFTLTGPLLFHLFVTEACPDATALPAAFRDLLGHTRPAIALDTPTLSQPIRAGWRIVLAAEATREGTTA